MSTHICALVKPAEKKALQTGRRGSRSSLAVQVGAGG
jgi:hypothetical protein